MDESEEESEILTVEEFLKDIYPIFAIMGIFGTVTLFLNGRFSESGQDLIGRGGILASLCIFAFTAALIGRNAMARLFSGLNEGNRPVSTEFGYALLTLSTVAIAYSIVNEIISSFTQLHQIVASVVAGTFWFILYVRAYPNERYTAGSLDPSGFSMIALTLGVLLTPLLGDYAMTFGIQLHQESLPAYLIERVTVGLLVILIHLSLSECLFGWVLLNQKVDQKEIKEKLNLEILRGKNFTEITIPRWSSSISVLVAMCVVIFLYLAGADSSTPALATTSSVFRDLSVLALVQNLIVAVSIGGGVFGVGEFANERTRQRLAQVGALGVVILVAWEGVVILW